MPLDVKKWVEDVAKKAGLTPEEAAQFETILSKPGARQEVIDGFERQSDYSRRMQELQQMKAEEDAYAARLAQWEQEVKTQLATAQQEANVYKAQVYNIAQQYNVAPEELQQALNKTTVPTPAPVQSVAQELPRDVVTKEQIDTYATAMFKINAKMIGLNQEHIRLFGKPMDNIDTFVDEALKAGQQGIKIEDSFRNFYRVADKEVELREAEVQARIVKAVEEEKVKWATNATNPLAPAMQGLPKGYQSPVLENVEGLDAKLFGDQVSHRTRVQEAVAAFNADRVQNGLPGF